MYALFPTNNGRNHDLPTLADVLTRFKIPVFVDSGRSGQAVTAPSGDPARFGRNDEWHVDFRKALSYNKLWRISHLVKQYTII
jgi:hypothetical protein